MSQETNAIFNDMLVKRLEQQDKRIEVQGHRIAAIEETIKAVPDYSKEIHEMSIGIGDLKTTVERIYFPTEEMLEFSKRLANGVALLRQPTETKVEHNHHIPKIIWISAGLFLVLALVCAGWYMTASKLDEYRGNDIKYRYLKLKSSPEKLRALIGIDSLYRSGYAMNDSVAQWEEDERTAIELAQRLQQKVGEGEELKEKLNVIETQKTGRRKD